MADDHPDCIGRMMVERFEDGREIFHIVGYYKDHRDSAVDGAIEFWLSMPKIAGGEQKNSLFY